MVTKIGLPENRKRLQGAAVERGIVMKFEESYDLGFKAGITHARHEIAKQIEAMEPSSNIDHIVAGYMMARNQAVVIAKGTND